ncbi:metal-dependent transcriptional regulator [Tomitella fengzijianii]|uniref:Manganese transport regulator n=1 Tax=Tomitella fengzijianii TaxID=2597660 RepID=A0A516X3K9_9ACTN|nr:metal-dependent transcriptional regulator [Tomitella fengzijianii]QDQ97662.1 metal-dependent transcriptional regulator [Tomitella fengzijianii]
MTDDASAPTPAVPPVKPGVGDPAAQAAPAVRNPAAALTPVAQDYLKVIWTATEWDDEPMSTKLLAERLGSAASTVSETVRRLADQHLVDHVRYGAITLTADGRAAALAMVRRHRLIETFLVRELDYSWAEVHDEAEVLEHAVSDVLVSRIDAKLGHPERDPHGDPIPRADGTLPRIPGLRLADLAGGAAGSITRISDEHPDMLRYFDGLGIAPGVVLQVLEHRDFAGTISVRVHGPGDAQEVRTVELGRPAADAIWLVQLPEAPQAPR